MIYILQTIVLHTTKSIWKVCRSGQPARSLSNIAMVDGIDQPIRRFAKCGAFFNNAAYMRRSADRS